MPVRVVIKAGEVIRWLQTEPPYWKREGKAILEILKDEGLRILREEVPIGKTRALHDSCWAETVSETRVDIGTDAPHAKYIDGHGRVAPSPGRYVPVIDRRLVRPSFRNPDIGTHPGFAQVPFSDRTADRVRAIAAHLMEQSLKKVPT